MVHTAVRRSHTNVRNSSPTGSPTHPALTSRWTAQDQRDETVPWSLLESDVHRVDGLGWQELMHEIGYLWPPHFQGQRERVRYSAERALVASVGYTARSRRWEDTYVERCLGESGKNATTLDETRRSRVMRFLLDHMASVPS